CRSCLSPPKIGALGSMYILHNYRLNMHNELVLTLTILQFTAAPMTDLIIPFLVVESRTSHGVELPPELCRLVMSPVSNNTLYSFSVIPSVMYRIQCLLLSARLKDQLGPTMQQFAIPA
uniref:Uncharacterized protein n=1 Tax=Aegilops tauschii subsp. strangulata TaxID=200361 RepID=A0A453JVS2_AEGTS